MKKIFLFLIATALSLPLTTALAGTAQLGVNTYMFTNGPGFEYGAYDNEFVGITPDMIVANEQAAESVSWNGGTGVSQWMDAVDVNGNLVLVNTGTDAAVDAAWKGFAATCTENITDVYTGNVQVHMDNVLDISTFGGSASGSSYSGTVIFNN